MPFETFTVGYRMLFKVEVLHRYFLNFGVRDFQSPNLPGDDLAQQQYNRRMAQLLRNQYDVRRFWRIEPDAATRTSLRDLHLVFKTLSDGFCVAVETAHSAPFVPLPDDLDLVFEAHLNDPAFLVYTGIAKNVCDELMKNNQVFRFENTGAATQTLNTGETIGATDLEDYAPPPGAVQKRPLGYLHLRHTPPTISLLTGTGQVPASRVYTVLLANRTTRWTFGTTDLNLHPLVANGLIDVSSGGKKLPNPTPTTTFYQNNEFVSIIY